MAAASTREGWSGVHSPMIATALDPTLNDVPVTCAGSPMQNETSLRLLSVVWIAQPSIGCVTPPGAASLTPS